MEEAIKLLPLKTRAVSFLLVSPWLPCFCRLSNSLLDGLCFVTALNYTLILLALQVMIAVTFLLTENVF
ncbi:hypothetical protein V5799_028416 [Amblyomma americanum]|uniref:Uncharacterized protein n=1 Tax=Amblyomma americanum TaxID=6943 RepID=A0AAQ4DCX8_AMBAM